MSGRGSGQQFGNEAARNGNSTAAKAQAQRSGRIKEAVPSQINNVAGNNGQTALLLNLQRLAGNEAVALFLTPFLLPVPAEPHHAIQRLATATLHPGTDRVLEITFDDSYFKDMPDTGDDEQDVYRIWELTGYFSNAAEDLGMTNITAAASYGWPTSITRGDYKFMVRWDKPSKRLVVSGLVYLGADKHHLLRGSAPLRWKMETQGILYAEDDEPVEYLHARFSAAGISPNKISVTASGGAVITLVIADQPYVVQYYRSAASFGTVLPRLKGLSKDKRASGTAKILEVNEAQRIVFVEKVQALNTLFPLPSLLEMGEDHEAWKTLTAKQRTALSTVVKSDWKKIFTQIRSEVLRLAKKGISQGDVRIDNIGRRGGDYVLFDYNAMRPATEITVKQDLKSLLTSLEGHGVAVPSALKENPTED